MTKVGKWLVGCDPEVFVVDYTNNNAVPAHDLVPGTKEEPTMTRFGQILPDGLALEFGIKPTRTLDRWHLRINRALEALDKKVRERNPSFRLAMKAPSLDFNPEVFAAVPDKAKELGCDPDYNAYTMAVNPPPGVSGEEPFRCVGGHVHLGFRSVNLPPHLLHTKENIALCSMMTRMCDIFLGAPSVLFDSDKRRRNMYGKAGAFRPKVYGMEYRTMSNRWMMNATLTTWVFNQVKHIETVLEENKYSAKQIYELSERAAAIINGGSVHSAARFVTQNEIPFPVNDKPDVKAPMYYNHQEA